MRADPCIGAQLSCPAPMAPRRLRQSTYGAPSAPLLPYAPTQPERTMASLIRRIATVSPFVVLGLNACLPYTVGSTARTVPAHETTRMTSWYYIPSALKRPADTIAVPLAGSDLEFRHGID